MARPQRFSRAIELPLGGQNHSLPSSSSRSSVADVDPASSEPYLAVATRNDDTSRGLSPSRASVARAGLELNRPASSYYLDTDSESESELASEYQSSQALPRSRSSQYFVSPGRSADEPSLPVQQTSDNRKRGSVGGISGQGPSLRHLHPASHVAVPSFSAFRSQTSSIPIDVKHNITLAYHTPKASSLSLPQHPLPQLLEHLPRPVSADSSLPPTPRIGVLASPPIKQTDFRSASASVLHSHRPNSQSSSIALRLTGSISSLRARARTSQLAGNEQQRSHVSMPSVSSMDSYSAYSIESEPTNLTSKNMRPPDLKLQFDGGQRPLSSGSQSSRGSQNSRNQQQAAPVSKLGAFFGWKSSSRAGTESPTTTFSDRSPSSPLPSPLQEKPLPRSPQGSRLTPPSLDMARANLNTLEPPATPLLLGTSQSNVHIKELEQELSHISSELAGSIRREMELEDELERLRAELPNPPLGEQNRRGSDYFSDSGASSTRYPISNVDERIEQLESKMRKVEQEKAQIKNAMASRVQVELSRRKELQEVIQQLEDQLDKRPVAGETAARVDKSKVQELELTLEETRRRMKIARDEKDSFEELYSATKLELAKYRNERDNLRDEVVPALRARLEGLEAQATETEALVYENTRMQQELAALRGDTPRMAQSRFAIAEEGGMHGISRSGSLARRVGALQRTGSVKGEGRARAGSIGTPVTADGLKEIEDQRDALHKALKLLLSRHDKQQRDHKRAVEKMTRTRDAADKLFTPRRSGYHREVAFLKEEVTTLRKRTEDALEQKWQYEKGLSGLKMDLDRAEQETRGLRDLLHQHDIVPRSRSNAGLDDTESESEDTDLSISQMERDRDQMRQLAANYRQQASAGSPQASALAQSATRIENLANQLDEEVRSNKNLRERLAQAVAKGENEQKASTRQIQEMQKRLAGLEDSVLAAQQHSETTLVNHESESRRIEEATSPQLERLVVVAVPEPSKLSPVSPFHPPRSPRSRKSAEASLLESGRTQMLERKVRELESLLHEAEEDMQTVVQRVNRSQLEVAELQTERDSALVQMRKLTKIIEEEKQRAPALMAGA